MKKFLSFVSLALVCTLLGTAALATAYTPRTSKEKPVVTENGEFTREQAPEPILVTSVGQSADVSMLGALLKKAGANSTLNPTAKPEEIKDYKTLIIATGASSKGLGAAGISKEDELARAEALLKAAEENKVTVIMAHLGGAARRGTLSDQFIDLVMAKAAYIFVVEDGNGDGKFTTFAAEKKVPITLLKTIASAMEIIKPLFGAPDAK